MAFPPISHMPFLSLSSSHFPSSHPIRSPSDIPAKTGRPSKMLGRQLHIRYLHLHPASQIIQRMPDPCFLYTSTRRHAQSPLRTVVMQDRRYNPMYAHAVACRVRTSLSLVMRSPTPRVLRHGFFCSQAGGDGWQDRDLKTLRKAQH